MILYNAHMNKAQRKEYQLTREQFALLVKLPGYRGACLSETMGPYWKDLYWSPLGSPAVVTNLTRQQVAAALGSLAKK